MCPPRGPGIRAAARPGDPGSDSRTQGPRETLAEPGAGLKDLPDLSSQPSGEVAVDYGHELVNIERLGDGLDGSVGEQFVDDVA